MAKKSKKSAKRRRQPTPVEIPEPSAPKPGREVTLDSVMRDLALIKAMVSSVL